MAKPLTLMVLLARLILSKEEELITVDRSQILLNDKGSQSYSFGYGVSDAQTGDVKTVWESKEGDTVKGHYSVLQPDGSVRTVEYSASPGKGFMAEVNNEEVKTEAPVTNQQNIQDKSYRDYKKPYEYSEDVPLEFYSSNEKRNKKRPYDSFYKDYSMFKRPIVGTDSESLHSDFPYNLPTKNLHDETGFDIDNGRFGLTHNSNCKTKHTKDSNHFYKNLEDLDFRKHKYPVLYTDSYNYGKYSDSPTYDVDKYAQRHKLKAQPNLPRPDEIGLPTAFKYSYPVLPDMPSSDNFYHDEIIQRPRKKHRPHKNADSYYPSDDLSDYVLVPKKKLKKPPRDIPDISDYPSDIDEDYDHSEDDDDRNHKPPRSDQKEVVRKIVKKRRPSIIKLLDILDI